IEEHRLKPLHPPAPHIPESQRVVPALSLADIQKSQTTPASQPAPHPAVASHSSRSTHQLPGLRPEDSESLASAASPSAYSTASTATSASAFSAANRRTLTTPAQSSDVPSAAHGAPADRKAHDTRSRSPTVSKRKPLYPGPPTAEQLASHQAAAGGNAA